MCTNAFNALSPEDQEIVRTAGRNSAELQRTLWLEREKVSMDTVKAGGVKVNTVEEKAPCQEAMAPVYEQFLASNPELADLVKMMQDFE